MSGSFSGLAFSAAAFDVEYDMTLTGQQIVTAALQEIRVVNATDAASGEDLAAGLLRLNLLVDAWNARREAIYAESILRKTFTPAASPHTIGPGGHFDVANRPSQIRASALVLSDGSRMPMDVHEGIDWWMGQASPELAGAEPTDLCYVPDYPLGLCYFWPVPSAASQVDLVVWALMDAGAVAETSLTLPVGYPLALILTLAEELAPMFGAGATLSSETIRRAAAARAKVFNQNAARSARVGCDAGLPGMSRNSRMNMTTGLAE